MYGTPPVVPEMLIDPSLLAQEAAVTEEVPIEMAAGSLTVTSNVAVQPLASVAVTVYPAALYANLLKVRPVNVASVLLIVYV